MDILAKLSRREKTILYSLAVIIILSVVYNFLIEPLFEGWNGVSQEINLARIRLQKSFSIIKEKDRISKEYAVYAERLKPKGSDEQEMTHILDGIEKLARGSNLKIANIKPKPPQDNLSYKRFMVGLDTESDMRSLMKFIYDVKNSPLLLKVDRLNLNTKSSQQGMTIRASMVISKITIN